MAKKILGPKHFDNFYVCFFEGLEVSNPMAIYVCVAKSGVRLRGIMAKGDKARNLWAVERNLFFHKKSVEGDNGKG